MGFDYYDYGKKRYWMSEGNVRSSRQIEEDVAAGRTKDTVLKAFLAQNSISVTTPEEFAFRHPFEQTFPAQQNPGFAGVPETEMPVEEALAEEKESSKKKDA